MDERIIQKIQDIEQQADHIRVEAEMNAAKRVEQATQQAKTMVAQAEDQARREAETMLEEARDWAHSERERILAQAEQEMRRLQLLADENSEAAADYVVERLASVE